MIYAVSFLKRFNPFITSLDIKGCPSLCVKIPIPFHNDGCFSFMPNLCVAAGGTVPIIPVYDFGYFNMFTNDNIHIAFVHILKI